MNLEETGPHTLIKRSTGLFALGLAWFAMSWFLIDLFSGDDRGSGAAAVTTCALLAALPMLAGAFVEGSRTGTQKLVRLGCAAVLAIEIAFLLVTLTVMFIPSLLFGGFVPVLGLYLLLHPEINQRLYGRE